MDTFSMSNDLSKGSVYESDTVCGAYMDDAMSRLMDGEAPVAISNEQIHSGDVLLETYRVEDDAIHGGMGSVWRVHHQSWDTDLAMKRPQPRFFAEGSERRKAEFVAECEHWINLGLHPNIVSCYYVRDIGGVPTIFSEWMDGGSLKDAIQSGRLYEGTASEVRERILDIAIQMARGLAYSHGQGLIHQDVKPGNILLAKDWDAKVADFGLAKAQSQLADGGHPASSGYTLAYCPKEQTEGAAAEAWMDVYAWALTVLEMYAGQRPWQSGAEAVDNIDAWLVECRVRVPEGLKPLLRDAVRRAYPDFEGMLEKLEAAFAQEVGIPYDRPAPKAAADTSDSLNNKALSFLDLGRMDDAERLWGEAIRIDNSNFRCHYNLAVALWKANRISAASLRQRIENQKEDSGLYARAEADTRFAVPRSDGDIRLSIHQTGVREPLPEEPFYNVTQYPYGEKRPGYATGEYECYLGDGDKIMDDSLDGRRKLGVCAAEKQYYLDDAALGRSRYRTFLENEYREDRDTLVAMRFVDPKGEIAVNQNTGYSIEFFNARTGRSLLTHMLSKDSEGDVVFSFVRRFSGNGFACISGYSGSGWWVKLPPADPQLAFSLSRIASFSQRQEAMRRLMAVLPEAEKAFSDGAYEQARAALDDACEDGTLLLYEPALSLWERLFPYFQPGKLITVLPAAPLSQRDGRWHAGEGNPQEPEGSYTEGGASDMYTALTSSYSYITYENLNNGMDTDITYSVEACDARTRRPFYTLSFMCCESDDHEFSYAHWFKLRGQYLWLKKPEDAQPTRVDLADPDAQRRFKLALALPGGYELKNDGDRVLIGNFTFEDNYEGLGVLSDQQLIRCIRRAYRLIYRYGERREPEAPDRTSSLRADDPDGRDAADTLSIGNTLTRDSVYKSDSMCLSTLNDAQGGLVDGKASMAISDEQIHEIEGVPTGICEWVDGSSLRDRIVDGSLYAGTVDEVRSRIFDIAAQAARALSFIHEKGIVHCDVKPANLLIGVDGVVRLNDFGLARRVPAKGAPASEPSLGFTPAYCPKEQAEGKPAKPWMDVYAWALTVLEMYAGKRLWATGAEAAEGFDDYLSRCRVTPPENMVKLLGCCLKWKVNDGSVVERELEKIDQSTRDGVPVPPGQESRPLPEGESQPAQERRPDGPEAPGDTPVAPPSLFDRLKKLFFGKREECRKGNHTWNGCRCRVCGAQLHEYEIVSQTRQESATCCWSSGDSCIGPDCGSICDCYYDGREGRLTIVKRCRRCGDTITETYRLDEIE